MSGRRRGRVVTLIRLARYLAAVVLAGSACVALEAAKVPVNYSLYTDSYGWMVSAGAGVVALWLMEIATEWMTRRRLPLPPKAQW